MALNKLKKWIGSQLFESFLEEYNQNVDATNAAIDLAEANAEKISWFRSFRWENFESTDWKADLEARIHLIPPDSVAMGTLANHANFYALLIHRYKGGRAIVTVKQGRNLYHAYMTDAGSWSYSE